MTLKCNGLVFTWLSIKYLWLIKVWYIGKLTFKINGLVFRWLEIIYLLIIESSIYVHDEILYFLCQMCPGEIHVVVVVEIVY